MIRTDQLRLSAAQAAAGVWSRARSIPRQVKAEAYQKARNRPILLLGEGLFIMLTLALYLPLTIRNTQQFTALYVLICLFYVLLAIVVSRAFVRPVFPVMILLGIQIWMLVSYVLVAPMTVPLPIVGRHLYWPFLVVLPYFVLGSICILDPSWRQKALKILFYFALINALVGVGQFLRLPGFGAIQQFYSPNALGVDYFGNLPNEFRAVGLTLHPYHLAAQCIFGMAVIGSNLFERKLYPRELVLFVLFLAALFVAQSRAYYAGGGVVLIVLLTLLYKRDKATFVWGVAGLAAAGSILMIWYGTRLEYGLRGRNTIEFGRVDRWQNAANLVKEFPLTGVGPSPEIFGNDKLKLPTRRKLEYTENGYRMMAATGGIPGLLLLIGGLLGSITLGFLVAKKHFRDSLQRRMGLIAALYIVSLVVALGISNMFEHELLTYFGMCTAAISLPDVGKAFASRRTRRKLGEGFANFRATSKPAEGV